MKISAILLLTTLVLSSLAGCSSEPTGTGGEGGRAGETGCRESTECIEDTPNGECVFQKDGCFGYTNNFQTYCSTDQDCASVGANASCFQCEQGHGVCLAECASDGDCKPGTTCDPNHHCVATACQSDGDCPANFGCSPTDQRCASRACQSDDDCSGHCVKGLCTAALGVCLF